MKIKIISLIVLLILSNIVFMQDILAREQVSIEDIQKLGLQVKMGELTGAGSKFSVHNLAGFILPDGVLMKEDCSAIVVKSSVDPKISDIIKIKIQDQEIEASEFIGFVVR